MEPTLDALRKYIEDKKIAETKSSYRKCLACGLEKIITASSSKAERTRKFYKFKTGHLCNKCNYAARKLEQELIAAEAARRVNEKDKK